ncbi:hypothetical protein BC833DRAFT_646701 [Globomyces pollinis-pini]|nr:hypothetical protein BC833DRAFT_646701 [Globomyces pollinis-pini]
MSSLHKYSKVYLAKKPIPKLYVGDEDSEESEDDLKTTVESAEKIQDTIIASYYRFRNQKRQQIREQTQSQESCWQTFTLNRKAVVNEDNRVVVNEVKTQLPEQEDHLDTGLLDTGDAAATLNLEHSIGDEDFIDYEETAGQESIVYRLKLREPRPLVEFKQDVQIPQWPSKFRNIVPAPAIQFIIPKRLERYNFSNSIPAKKPLGHFREPRLVYKSSNDKKFQEYQLESPDDNTLLFESRFESGNLLSAHQTSTFAYDLEVKPDLNTAGHTQWFYFRVKNMISGVDYRFNIKNLMKPKCLYSEGMKALMYSEKLSKNNSKGWFREGKDISYTCNDQDAKVLYYTLSFTVQFPETDDVVYFAHCYPYTYTYWQEYLHKIKYQNSSSQHLKHKILGKSVAGNNIDMLSITTKVYRPSELARRPAIILIARVHPGETNASWMMHGFIEFILGETMEAKFLRDNYVIKLIPMINPDGVIVGNHRCNLNGYDLNRQWKVQEKSKNIVPEVWLVKQMIKRTLETREIAMYCDFHGHNRKHGVFIYGCNNDNRPQYRCVEKVFPLMLSKAEPDLFFFKRCQFRLQKRKEGTSRIVLFKEFNILNSFTLEASFCGSDINGKEFHFNLEHLNRMGSSIGKTFYQYFSDGETVDKCRQEVTDAIEKGNNEYIADESESEDTTSDDELLRKRAAKKKKQKSKPKVSSPASSRPSTASRSKPIPTVLYKNTGDSTVERPTIQSRPSTPRPNSRQTSIASLQKPAGTLKVQNMSPGVSRSEPDLRNSARGSMIKSQARNSLPGRLNAVLARHANSVTYIPIVSLTDFNVNVRPVTSECSFPVGVKSKPNRKPSLTSCSKGGFCGGDTKSCLK